MITMSARTIATLAYAGLIIAALPQKASKTPEAQPGTDTFPSETILVVQDPVHNRTYFAAQNRLQERGSKAQFSFTGQDTPPESVVPSADGKLLLLRTSDDSYLLQAVNLHLMRHLSNSYAWWEGSHLGYLDDYHGTLFTGGHRFQTIQRRTEFVAVDSTGGYFLGTHMIRRGNIRNGNTPTYRLQLWRKTPNGTFHVVRNLMTDTYDPASEGNPRHLEILGNRVAVFGVPNGFADDEDFIGVLQGSRVKAPLKDARGRPLQFEQSPLVTRKAIVGIAEAIGSLHTLTRERYLYQITEKKTVLKPIAKNVLFVTYNAKRDSIGLGLAGHDNVSVKYNNF